MNSPAVTTRPRVRHPSQPATAFAELTRQNLRLRGDAAVEIGPHMLREIVQLAASHRVPVVAPREDFGIQSLVESGREPRLSLLEAVERNAHVHMMGAVLENVVD